MNRFFISLILLVKQLPTGLLAQPILNYADIISIYNDHIKPYQTEEFSNKYTSISTQKSKLPSNWHKRDFARVISLLEFERFVREYEISSVRALSINSGKDPEWEFISTEYIKHINYLDDLENHDLHQLNLDDYDFDFIMLGNVLDHVYNPVLCIQNLYKHLKPGGIIYTSVTVNSIPHETPHHYYTGITPTGLCSILIASGFRILSVGSWGNFDYIEKMHKNKKWPNYHELSKPIHNDFDYPVTTWAFAIKD
jgi:SAM-dependent methyltransferase